MKVNNGPKKNTQPDSLNANIVTEEDPAPCSLNFNGLKNANAISTSEIVLTWDAAEHNCNTVVYRVYDYSNLSRAIGTTPNTTYTVQNLVSNQDYTFRVKAIGDDYEFPTAVIQSATTLSTNPQCELTFGGISGITVASSNSADITWSAAVGCDGYNITYRLYQNSEFYVPLIDTGNLATTVSDLSSGTLYSYVVRPVVNGTEYSNLDVSVTFGLKSATCENLPSHAEWNNANRITQEWDGSAWTPSEVPAYSATASTEKCYYKCLANFNYYSGSCVETSAPAATTLSLESYASDQVWLSWVAPGDNENSGTASAYEIRYSTSTITESNYASATIASSGGIPDPVSAGTQQMGNINGLTTGQTYYFAMKTRDAYYNWSPMSNVVSTTTGIGFAGMLGWGFENWHMPYNRIMYVTGVALDSKNNIYTLDRSGSRVMRFDSNANFTGWIGNGQDGWQMGGTGVSGSGDRYFSGPTDIEIDSSDNIYVADATNDRIQKWTSDGEFSGNLGSGSNGWLMNKTAAGGAADKYLDNPYGLELDNSGNLYVADESNNRIVKYDSNGIYQGWIGGGSDGWQTGANGTGANGDKNFNAPKDVAVDVSGNIYVADKDNNRIQKWLSNGTYVGWFGGGSNGWKTGDGPGQADGDAEFDLPYSVQLDSSGNFYIADYANYRIAKWDSDANYVGWIGKGDQGWQTGTAGSGFEASSFNGISRLAIDSSGNILIASYSTQSVKKWTSDGIFSSWFSGTSDGWSTNEKINQGRYAEKYFFNPTSASADSYGNFYIADYSNHCVKKFDRTSGAYVGWIGGGNDGWQTGTTPPSSSSNPGYISNATAVATDSAGNIYAGDYSFSAVTKWTSDGTFIGWIGGGSDGWHTGNYTGWGTGRRDLKYPYGISVHEDGTIYIADYGNHRVQKWQSDGTHVGWIGGNSNGWQTGSAPASSGTGDAAFKYPRGRIVFDDSGNLYIADGYNHRVQKWTTSGNYIGWIGGGSDGWQTGTAPAASAAIRSFNYPRDVFLYNNNLHIADYASYRIQKWSTDGTFLGIIGQGTPGFSMTNSYLMNFSHGYITSPIGFAMDSNGWFYMVDYYSRIFRFK